MQGDLCQSYLTQKILLRYLSGTVFSAEGISSQPDHSYDEYCDGPVNVLLESCYEGCQGGRIEPCGAPAYLKSDIIVEVPRAKLQPSTNPQWREVEQMASDSIRFGVLVDTCKGTRSSRSEKVGSNAKDVFSTRPTRAELEKVIAQSMECQFDSLMKRDFTKLMEVIPLQILAARQPHLLGKVRAYQQNLQKTKREATK
jgi:hypothetical protein